MIVGLYWWRHDEIGQARTQRRRGTLIPGRRGSSALGLNTRLVFGRHLLWGTWSTRQATIQDGFGWTSTPPLVIGELNSGKRLNV